MDLGIEGKIALVTGGSHGIGLATAKALGSEGCRVAICARSPERLEQAEAALAGSCAELLVLSADVFDPDAHRRVLAAMVARWGGIDILVNNVGGGGRWGSAVVEETEERVWHEVYEKNATAAIRFTMAAIPHMRRKKWGRVVTVTSRLGREGGGRPWFNMAKAAQTSMMKTLGMNHELARDGITFNSVAPGGIMIPDTGWEELRDRDPEAYRREMDASPLGRLGTPEEVAAVIAFVCSAGASLVNGAAIAVDGAESRAF